MVLNFIFLPGLWRFLICPQNISSLLELEHIYKWSDVFLSFFLNIYILIFCKRNGVFLNCFLIPEKQIQRHGLGPHQDLGIGERELGRESIFFLLEKDTDSFNLKPGLSLRIVCKGFSW